MIEAMTVEFLNLSLIGAVFIYTYGILNSFKYAYAYRIEKAWIWFFINLIPILGNTVYFVFGKKLIGTEFQKLRF